MWASCNKKWLDEGLAESCVSALGTSVSADFSTDRRPAPLSQRDSGTIHQSVTRHRYLRPLMDSLLAVEPSTMYRHGHMATNGFPSVLLSFKIDARCAKVWWPQSFCIPKEFNNTAQGRDEGSHPELNGVGLHCPEGAVHPSDRVIHSRCRTPLGFVSARPVDPGCPPSSRPWAVMCHPVGVKS